MISPQPSIDPNAHSLFEQAPALINILKGREGVCELFNPPLAKWWGFRQVIGLPMRQAWPELHDTGIFESVEKVYDTDETIYLNEFRASWNKGGEHHENFFNFVFAPYKENQQTVGVMIFGQDVTDVVLSRRRIEESQKELVQLADAMPQLVWIMDGDGKVTYYNKRIWDFAFTDSAGPEFLAKMIHPDDIPETHRLLSACLRNGKPFECEHRLMMKGGEYRWHLTRAIPETHSEGKATRWFATATDIHKQKNFEESLEMLVARRTSALEESNKKLVESNNSLEQFAYVVSHDLQAPLRKIKSFGELLKKHLAGTSQEALTTLQRIQASADRMKLLMDGVLEYSKLSAGNSHTEKVNLNTIISEVLIDLELVIKLKQATINVGPLFWVKGDPVQFRQVFHNLIGNALKFSRPEIPPTVTITSSVSEDRSVQYIEVADNGVGFDAAFEQKIFELFQRAHSQHEFEGTGIGLSLVKKIVERHGGQIAVKSVQGQGTTFRLSLPLGRDN